MALRVDRPLQGRDDVAKVLPHGRFGGIGVAAGQGFDDGFVLAQ